MKGKTHKRDDVSHLLAALHEMSAPGHSPLYLWMRRNHDRMVEGLQGMRPSWRILAARLGTMGIVDGTGKAPSPQGARATWYRVRRNLAAARARPSKAAIKTQVTLLPSEIAPGVTVSPPASPPTSTMAPSIPSGGTAEGNAAAIPSSRPRLDIRPARPRSDPPATSPAAAPVTTAAPTSLVPVAEPAEMQLRRVLDAMATSTTPMPRIVPSGQKR